MSDEIGRALERLSRQPVPCALAQTELTVLDRIAAFDPRQRDVPGRFAFTAVVLALGIGIAGGVLPLESQEEASLYPLAPVSRLAPSALLSE